MRPLQLTIEGVRSFKPEVTLDFTDRNHVAIIGDTGAGKSSILEAITYALFGCLTFTKQPNQVIMNDLSTHLRVVLKFTVAGRFFEVVRTLRRAGDGTVGRPEVAMVELSDNGDEMRKVDGSQETADWVEGLLGLDYDAFLRTVILPQGKFAQLLVGDSPRERADILRQVWRTDELTAAGQLTDDTLAALRPLAARAEQALEWQPDDPRGHLDKLKTAATTAGQAAEQARKKRRTAAEAAKQLTDAAAALNTARQLAHDLRAFDTDAARSAARRIAAVAGTIADERERLEREDAELRGKLDQIPRDDDGMDRATIGAARTTLDQLPTHAQTVATRAASARSAAEQAQSRDEELNNVREKLKRLDARLKERREARVPLAEQVDGAIKTLESARSHLRDARQQLVEAENDRTHAAKQADRAAGLRAEAQELTDGDLATARTALERAADHLADQQRTDAAAEVAHGLHPGDDCPICNRSLPQDWSPPTSEDLDAIRRAHEHARIHHDALVRRHTKLLSDAEAAEGQANELRSRVDEHERAAAGHLDELASALARDRVITEEVHRDDDGDELIAPPTKAVDDTERKLAEFDGETQQVRESRAGQQCTVEGLEDAVGQLDSQASSAREELDGALETLRSGVDGLPDNLPVALSLPENPLTLERVDIDGLVEARAVLDEREAELDARAQVRTELQEQREELHRQRRDLDARSSDDVTVPGRDLTRTLSSVRDTIGQAKASLALDAAVPDAVTLDDQTALAEHTSAFVDAVSSWNRTLAAAADEAENQVGTSRRTLTDLAKDTGLSTDHELDPEAVVSHLDEQATADQVEARTASRDVEEFEALVDPLVELQEAAAELNDAVLVLDDLSRALKPGAFPKWLTLRRSRALLVHASKLLSQMSGGRYAFADLDDAEGEWLVVDKDSNLPRAPASLSGGEKFIASLSLALGMVEMMARSGGRLESLWLDEGFGSLDRTNLDAAVEALAQVAAEGRMVAVISHVKAVAEQVDHVLGVVRTVRGTQASWLTSDQRREVATSDVTGGATGLDGLLD